MDWGQVAAIAGTLVAVAALIIARLDRVHKRIDDHMNEEESSLAGVHDEIKGVRLELGETNQNVAYIAGRLDIDLRKGGAR